jgi:hypothetical protein
MTVSTGCLKIESELEYKIHVVPDK